MAKKNENNKKSRKTDHHLDHLDLHVDENGRIVRNIPIEELTAFLNEQVPDKKMNEDKIRLLPHAEYLNSAGYSTILIDLRSFGKSEGDKTSLGIQEWKDVETAYDYAKSLPENKNKIIGFYGKSMGGVTAIITRALTDKGDFIIALTPYASFGGLFNFQLKQKGYYAELYNSQFTEE